IRFPQPVQLAVGRKALYQGKQRDSDAINCNRACHPLQLPGLLESLDQKKTKQGVGREKQGSRERMFPGGRLPKGKLKSNEHAKGQHRREEQISADLQRARLDLLDYPKGE